VSSHEWHPECTQCCRDCSYQRMAWGRHTCVAWSVRRGIPEENPRSCPHLHYNNDRIRENYCAYFTPKTRLLRRKPPRIDKVKCQHTWARVGLNGINMVIWCFRCGSISLATDESARTIGSLWRLRMGRELATSAAPLLTVPRKEPAHEETGKPSEAVDAERKGASR
jgi:hypothetical protein